MGKFEDCLLCEVKLQKMKKIAMGRNPKQLQCQGVNNPETFWRQALHTHLDENYVSWMKYVT